jgi:ClpX C4-type zinc finger
MHDTDKDGNEFFKCDFCRQAWAEDRPMVEGHRGSLVCGPCLALAYRLVHLNNGGETVAEDVVCTLCLQHHDAPHWRSPVHESSVACKRCIKQSARVLQKDVESGWKIPTE